MKNSVLSFYMQLLGHVLVGALFGYLLDFPLLFALLGALICYGRLAYWLTQVHNWAQKDIDLDPPPAPGMLGSITHKFRNFQRAQKKRQERLQFAMKRFQQSASALSDAIVIIDSHDEIEWWNQAGEEILGLLRSDRGQSLLNLLRSPDFVRYYRSKDHERPVEVVLNDPHKVVEFRLHHFGDGDKVLVARDITEMHKLESMRRDFVANASHELRTPLTVIHGYLETLQDHDLSPVVSRAIDTMYRQSARMENLVSDLLTLSKLESVKSANDRSNVSICPMLEQIAAEARSLSDTSAHQISVECDGRVDLTGNAKELQSAFSNLVFNAVRYTPPGGKIHIEFKRTAQGARFAVTDTGVGIASHHIPRLTERFYRVDDGRSREDGGTGLGLAIVKHVLARHNARLEIQSTPGQGSQFICLFPSERVN